MAKINLRPWREELRAERKQQFYVVLIGVMIIAAGLVVLQYQNINSSIRAQTARNDFIQKEISVLDAKIQEIESLKESREQLLDRMRIIQELQGNRPVIVRLFDELVRVIPDGLFITRVQRQGSRLSIQGRAESNNRISNLLRNFDQSPWFSSPNLTKVEAVDETKKENEFVLTVQQSITQSEDAEL